MPREEDVLLESGRQPPARIAILSGGGGLPVEAAIDAQAIGHDVLMIAIADEADFSALPASIRRERVEWGQVGALFRLLTAFQTDKLVLVGSIGKRPDFHSLRLDWGAVQLLPRILSIVMGGGDEAVLDKVSTLFAERGFELAGVHEVAPHLLATTGLIGGPNVATNTQKDMSIACQAAWTAGRCDMGQGAVSVGGRLVAMEGAEGTDGLLARVGQMRSERRFSAKGAVGVLAKCPRPGQDRRLDMPTIGPRTIEGAKTAELACLVVEAGSVLVSQREETRAACAQLGISLIGKPRSFFLPPDQLDERG